MTPRRIFVAYFSPAGGTRRVARMLLSALRGAAPELEEIDLTPPEARRRSLRFEAGDLVFWCAPVYYGRLALPLQTGEWPGFAAQGAAGVPVAVYGNRAYEDALREMADVMTQGGFAVTAGAAFVAQHSQCPELAAGRPDERDRAEAVRFARAVLAHCGADTRAAIPGAGSGEPLRPYLKTPAAPRLEHPERCHKCGDCAEKCPLGIIDPLSFAVTEPEACILCRACMKACPDGARDLPEPVKSAMAARMAQIAAANAARRDPELFV